MTTGERPDNDPTDKNDDDRVRTCIYIGEPRLVGQTRYDATALWIMTGDRPGNDPTDKKRRRPRAYVYIYICSMFGSSSFDGASPPSIGTHTHTIERSLGAASSSRVPKLSGRSPRVRTIVRGRCDRFRDSKTVSAKRGIFDSLSYRTPVPRGGYTLPDSKKKIWISDHEVVIDRILPTVDTKVERYTPSRT